MTRSTVYYGISELGESTQNNQIRQTRPYDHIAEAAAQLLAKANLQMDSIFAHTDSHGFQEHLIHPLKTAEVGGAIAGIWEEGGSAWIVSTVNINGTG